MNSRDAGLIAVVVAGGLGMGWAFGNDIAVPATSKAAPERTQSASPTPQQFSGTSAPAAAPIPVPGRTAEGEAVDEAVRARARTTFQSAMEGTQVDEAPPPTRRAASTQSASSSATTGGGSWGGQPTASGGGWGGQGVSGSGWGTQAGVAPQSATPAASPARAGSSPAPAASQQPSG